MGADRGILVKTDQTIEPLAVAKIIKAIAWSEKPGLDHPASRRSTTTANQAGQMLAALLDWPQATFAAKLGAGRRQAPRSAARSMAACRRWRSSLPAVITTDLRLNQPRYASLPNIMKAKKKPIDEKTPADFGVDITPRSKCWKFGAAQARRRHQRSRALRELLDKLKADGVI